jgi:transcriptional regulator with XRE-family HTH domain
MDTLIPAFLRRQRNQRRLTLEMLSAKVGMSPEHLSEIESGKRDPRLSSIERMAGASFTIETFEVYERAYKQALAKQMLAWCPMDNIGVRFFAG